MGVTGEKSGVGQENLNVAYRSELLPGDVSFLWTCYGLPLSDGPSPKSRLDGRDASPSPESARVPRESGRRTRHGRSRPRQSALTWWRSGSPRRTS